MSNIATAVSAINRGTVIDHIQAGYGIKIAQFLQLLHGSSKIILCLNLKSNKMGTKDLIKVSPTLLPKSSLNKIAVFSPTACVNWIEESNVISKESVKVPDHIDHIFKCPNHLCITNAEFETSNFKIARYKQKLSLECTFCSKNYSLDDLQKGCL